MRRELHLALFAAQAATVLRERRAVVFVRLAIKWDRLDAQLVRRGRITRSQTADVSNVPPATSRRLERRHPAERVLLGRLAHGVPLLAPLVHLVRLSGRQPQRIVIRAPLGISVAREPRLAPAAQLGTRATPVLVLVTVVQLGPSIQARPLPAVYLPDWLVQLRGVY